MMYFKVTMRKREAVTEGKAEIVRHFSRETIIELLLFLEDYPIIQPGRFGYEIRLINDITKAAYEDGMTREDKNLFEMRYTKRMQLCENCLLEPTSLEFFSAETILAKTIDYSRGGFCVEHMAFQARKGSRFQVSIKALSTFQKNAEVIWTKSMNQGVSLSGFKWI